jgi:pimeloyl-ACP methyl ester carboxylesterase
MMKNENRLDHLAARVNANAALRRGQLVNATVLVEVGSTGWLVEISNGRIASVEKNVSAKPSVAFALRASAADWGEFWQSVPKPGFHDLMALLKTRRLAIDGDMLSFLRHLRYFKEVLASVRAEAATTGIRA